MTEVFLALEASPSRYAAAEVNVRIAPITGGGPRPVTDGSSEECGGRRYGHVPTRSMGGIPDAEPRSSAGAVKSESAGGRGALSARSDNCLDCAGRYDRRAPSVAAELDSRGDEVGVSGDADLKHAAPLEGLVLQADSTCLPPDEWVSPRRAGLPRHWRQHDLGLPSR